MSGDSFGFGDTSGAGTASVPVGLDYDNKAAQLQQLTVDLCHEGYFDDAFLLCRHLKEQEDENKLEQAVIGIDVKPLQKMVDDAKALGDDDGM